MRLIEIFSEPIYAIETSSGKVVFKLLNNKDYSTISHILYNYPDFKYDLEDEIWDLCVIEHNLSSDKNTSNAGLITTIAQLILYLSSPKSIDKANISLQSKRDEISNIKEQAIITICQAFPSYLPEHLEKLDWDTLLKRLAQSEVILERQFEFKNTASQVKDDSVRILNNLEEYTNEVIDFSKANKELADEEYGTPQSNNSLRNTRGR